MILREQMQAQRQMLEDALKELKKQNEQLRATVEQVKKRNFELAEIAYQTSHDLRGPASTLQGLANLMAVEKDPELINSFIKEVPLLLAKIDTFSKSISDFAQITNKPQDYQEINWEDLFSRVTQDKADKAKMDLGLNIHQKFHTDAQRLANILDELLRNALQFNTGNQELVIDVNIEVSNGYAVLEVIDNGIGIENLEKDKIFELFYRGSPHHSGSGVGLYVVKTLVEDLGGEISVGQNENNKGACFIIRLPNLAAPVTLPEFNF